VQRRRRPKVAPRNVFGGNIPPRPQKKSKDNPIRKDTPSPSQQSTIEQHKIINKPSDKVKILSKNEILIKNIKEGIEIEQEPPEVEKEVQIVKEIIGKTEQILEDNILGRKTKKKSIGLQKKVEIKVEEEDVLPSSKAMELIEKSRIRATEKTLIKAAEKKPKVVDVKKKSRPRGKQKTYQPATRLKRLDRSKHMEYKYEMRSLMVDIEIIDEYRSNLLASIWAKGERQSTKEAKEYIDDKMIEGILNEKQHKSLLKVIENYTTRR
jgi:hypothetical protein